MRPKPTETGFEVEFLKPVTDLELVLFALKIVASSPSSLGTSTSIDVSELNSLSLLSSDNCSFLFI